jgi:uncharacterized membrane protein
MAKIRVLYVGDSDIETVTYYVGFDSFSFSRTWDESPILLGALAGADNISVRHLASADAMEDFPGSMEALRAYDVLILSDIGSNNIALQPGYVPPYQVPMGLDRMALVKQWTAEGGGLAMVGGWFSFSGFRCMAGYGGTQVEDVLPVTCMRGIDDRVEVPQGYRPTLTPDGERHPITSGLGWSEEFLLLGYNRVIARREAAVLAERDGDPWLVVGGIGRGRSIALAGDLAPHWSGSWNNWPDYPRFWQRCVAWLAGRLPDEAR